MHLNTLETEILTRFLNDPYLAVSKSAKILDEIRVNTRDLTGAGFITDLRRSDALMLFESPVSLRWGQIGGRLKPSGTDTGYVVYVDSGRLTAIEGYTYGEPWPTQIDGVELYDLSADPEDRI